MRIGINARVLSEPLRGANRSAVNLVSGLAALGAELYLYTDVPFDAELAARLPAGVHVRESGASGSLRWLQQWLPRECGRDAVEVFHSPAPFGLPQFSRVKCVLTLRDAAEEDREPQKMDRLLCRIARRRADHIVTVSEASRAGIVKRLGLPEHRITVVHESADPRFGAEISEGERGRIRRKYSLPEHYLFYAGSLQTRKKLPVLLKASAQSGVTDLHVVLAGGSEDDAQTLLRLAADLRIGDRVMLLGRVADDDLPGLYAEARAVAVPGEGSGVQICEAMAAGCPVLAAEAGGLPEMVGEGGDLFPLDDSSRLAGILTRLHYDAAYREDLRRRARLRAQEFSQEKMAAAMLAVYERVAKA